MTHKMSSQQQRAHSPLDLEAAEYLARTLQALGSATRLLLLDRLRVSSYSVNALAEAVGMEPSAVSHQLRLLKAIDIVKVRREGRHHMYSLADDHVSHLVEQALYHAEHVRLAASRPNPAKKRALSQKYQV